ncbi:MAG: replicative DNA helicase [Planctomycetota bacterium]|jgi:replicative DNA helicase
MIQKPPQTGVGERVPPQDLQAERAVLGSVLIDNEVLGDVLTLLDRRDFYRTSHQVIFGSITELFDRGEAVDVVILRDELQRTGNLEKAGGEEALLDLSDAVPTSANADHYARIVRDLSLRRAVVRECTKAVQQAYEGEMEGRELLDFAEGLLFNLDREAEAGETVHIGDVLTPLFKEIDSGKQSLTGLQTHFHELDDLTGGLQPSELIVVAGRPSMGKTTIALNVAEQIGVVEKVPVAIFSLEMAKAQLVMNMLCSNARVNAHSLRRGVVQPDEWPKLSAAAGRLSDAAIFVDDTPALSVLGLRAKVRRLKARQNIGMVIVDYLQLMEAPRAENRQQEITHITRSLKSLARELEIPVIAISQLNRAVDAREDHRPRMSDLRESGAIEQDADLILFLYRDEYYDPREDNQGIAEVIVAKQRNGPTGSVKLTFLNRFMRFENLATYQPPF